MEAPTELLDSSWFSRRDNDEDEKDDVAGAGVGARLAPPRKRSMMVGT